MKRIDKARIWIVGLILFSSFATYKIYDYVMIEFGVHYLALIEAGIFSYFPIMSSYMLLLTYTEDVKK